MIYITGRSIRSKKHGVVSAPTCSRPSAQERNTLAIGTATFKGMNTDIKNIKILQQQPLLMFFAPYVGEPLEKSTPNPSGCANYLQGPTVAHSLPFATQSGLTPSIRFQLLSLSRPEAMLERPTSRAPPHSEPSSRRSLLHLLASRMRRSP